MISLFKKVLLKKLKLVVLMGSWGKKNQVLSRQMHLYHNPQRISRNNFSKENIQQTQTFQTHEEVMLHKHKEQQRKTAKDPQIFQCWHYQTQNLNNYTHYVYIIKDKVKIVYREQEYKQAEFFKPQNKNKKIIFLILLKLRFNSKLI